MMEKKNKTKLKDFIEEINKEITSEVETENLTGSLIKDSDDGESNPREEGNDAPNGDKIVIDIKDIKKDSDREKTNTSASAEPDSSTDDYSQPVDAIVQEAQESDDDKQPADAEMPSAPRRDVHKILEELTAEKDEYKDKFLRKAAELENYIKRSRKEKEELRDLIIADFTLQMLSVTDNFDRALSLQNSTAEQILEGLKMTETQLFNILKEYGLQPIPNSVGQTFDPQIHEAIFIEPTDDYPANTIIEEYLRGFLFKDYTLRPSKVRVAVAKPEKDESLESTADVAETKTQPGENDEVDSEEKLEAESPNDPSLPEKDS